MEAKQVSSPFVVRVAADGESGIVAPEGELDVATRHLLERAWRDVTTSQVVIDLGGLTFMDCAGYQAIAQARSGLSERGRSLAVRSGDGQPHRLLQLIASLDGG